MWFEPVAPIFLFLSIAVSGQDYVASLVGRTFLRALTDRDVQTAASLCAAKVNFDGRILEGPAVHREIQDMVHRLPQGYRFKKVVVLTYPQAEKRFGPVPKRLAAFVGPRTVVAFGRLPHRGLVVFIRRVRGRWRVVALTE